MALTLSSHGPAWRTGISIPAAQEDRLENARTRERTSPPSQPAAAISRYAFLFPSSVFIVSSTVETTFSSPMQVLIMML
jgi:hypothetical protein